MRARRAGGTGAETAWLTVRVVTRASKRALECAREGVLKAHLNSPPVGGRANQELVELVAQALRLPRSRVEVARGEKSRDKVVKVSGIKAAEAWRLLQQVGRGGRGRK